MNKLWELFRDKTLNKIILLIIYISSLAGIIILSYTVVPFNKFLLSIPLDIYLSVIVLSVLTIFIMSTYISYLRKQIKADKFKDWEFIDKYGIWKHNELYYCPNCKTKDIVAPMLTFDTGWECVVLDCRRVFRNEKYNPPPPGIKRSGRNIGINDW